MTLLSKYRWLIVGILHLGLAICFAQLNSFFASFGPSLLVIGLAISFSSLSLSYGHGILSLLLAGLYLESKAPLPTGYITLGILTLHLIFFVTRSRYRRESKIAGPITSLLANAMLFAIVSLASARAFGLPPEGMGYAAWNLFWSSLVIVLISKFYFALQTDLLALFGIRLEEEQREA